MNRTHTNTMKNDLHGIKTCAGSERTEQVLQPPDR